jgi:hypothetical protein
MLLSLAVLSSTISAKHCLVISVDRKVVDDFAEDVGARVQLPEPLFPDYLPCVYVVLVHHVGQSFAARGLGKTPWLP